MDRRRALLLGLAAASWPVAFRARADEDLSPPEAHRLAAAGRIILIDVRRPDEWLETGVPEHATPIQMEHPLFMAKLEAIPGAGRTKPIVLICQAGVRTTALRQKLIESGYPAVSQVRGGVAGFGGEKGWVGYGLPVVEGP
jgi:rhodanese-related sulfurtransferase